LPQQHFPSGFHARYHYAPAGLVSGDYCDLFQSNGSLIFLLGDVSGKGVAASMQMSHLHATFRSLANVDLPLDCMVQAANRIFAESTLAGQFATLIVGRASQDGAVEFVSAGHLPSCTCPPSSPQSPMPPVFRSACSPSQLLRSPPPARSPRCPARLHRRVTEASIRTAKNTASPA